MTTSKHILVIRFSSMGDVAMTVPVIKNVLVQNPQLRITVVSNAVFKPLFEGLENCAFYPAFLKKQHKGMAGLWHLFRELTDVADFDGVADLHNVLRSRLLGLLFQVKGRKMIVLDKGRKEKKALTRKDDKIYIPLTSMHERYADVFRKMGLIVQLHKSEPVYAKRDLPVSVQHLFSSGKNVIGVAPFAQYKEKMYPIEKMKKVVSLLASADIIILLFGGGEYESAVLQQWETEISSVFSVAGRYSLNEELAIISNIDSMISMDSANMHLASLFKIRVISVWGATHPFSGFNGWAQHKNNMVQIDLYCRPCSVFGNNPCYRGDHACMNRIAEENIVEKIVNNP